MLELETTCFARKWYAFIAKEINKVAKKLDYEETIKRLLEEISKYEKKTALTGDEIKKYLNYNNSKGNKNATILPFAWVAVMINYLNIDIDSFSAKFFKENCHKEENSNEKIFTRWEETRFSKYIYEFFSVNFMTARKSSYFEKILAGDIRKYEEKFGNHSVLSKYINYTNHADEIVAIPFSIIIILAKLLNLKMKTIIKTFFDTYDKLSERDNDLNSDLNTAMEEFLTYYRKAAVSAKKSNLEPDIEAFFAGDKKGAVLNNQAADALLGFFEANNIAIKGQRDFKDFLWKKDGTGAFYGFFPPTETEEQGFIKGEFTITFNGVYPEVKFKLLCSYDENRDGGRLKDIDGDKEYYGLLMRSKECHVAYILLANETLGELSMLTFNYQKTTSHKFESAICEVLTCKSGLLHERYPTVHRMLISRQDIPHPQVVKILPHLSQHNSDILIRTDVLDSLLAGHPGIINPDKINKFEVSAFKEEDLDVNLKMPGDLDLLTEIRARSLHQRNDKIGRKPDEYLYNIVKNILSKESKTS
jgi:hypothetical protein